MTDAFADRGWISPDGLELHARDYPPASGPARLPVICIHGLTRNAKDFEDLAPRLARMGRRVLALDVRGRGGSARDPNPMNYQPAVYAQDVNALMAEAGIARAHFVGTSMGGIITMVLASLRGDLMAGAVINDIGPEVSPVGVARIASYTGVPPQVLNWDDAAAYVRHVNAGIFPDYRHDDWDRMARRVFREDEAGRPVLDYDPDIAVPMRQAEGLAPPPMWPLWTALATGRPVLAVRGEISDLLAADCLGRMLQSSPTVSGVEVRGVGHAPMLDEPEAVEAIEQFFAQQP